MNLPIQLGVLFLAGVMAVAAYAAPAAPPAVKKKPVATAARKRTVPKVSSASRNRKITSSRAIYSRSNSRRGRGTATRVTAAKSQSNWQARPSAERYAEIQQALAAKGFFKGEANGTWGADSVAALKEFQRSQNLDPDGKLGSLSLIALGMGPKRIIASADPQGAMAPPPAASPQSTAAPENTGRQQ